MRVDTEFEPAAVAGMRTHRHAPWLAAGFAFAAILALYWRTAADMVVIWSRSETFTHGFLVLPISLWLVWRKRAELRRIAASPWFPALVLVGGAGLLWLLSDLASVASPAEFSLVLMLQFATLAVLGLRVARAMLFPLAFLLFAVPAGEFLVPMLMDTTADFTILALQATGIPVYREGNHFMIPTGNWSVVEACSGIRYLIASMMAGSLFAYLTYRTPWKRAAFFAVAIAVPIFANWLRAYLIVMVGHLSGNKYAAGVDHLIYGWLFFGIVIAIMFWIGSFWREDEAAPTLPAQGAGSSAAPPLSSPPSKAFALAAAGAILAAALWLPAGYWVEASVNPALPGPLAVAPEHGWRALKEQEPGWKPTFSGHRAEFQALFAKDGREVGLYIAYYSHQTQDHELINSENVLVRTSDPRWKEIGSGRGVLDWSGSPLTVSRADLRGPEERLAVAKLYWIAGRHTSSDVVAKLLLALQKLTFRDDDAAAVVLYTRQGDAKAPADEALGRFATEMSGAVDRALTQASRRGD